jgi:hypothetical protein
VRKTVQMQTDEDSAGQKLISHDLAHHSIADGDSGDDLDDCSCGCGCGMWMWPVGLACQPVPVAYDCGRWPWPVAVAGGL